VLSGQVLAAVALLALVSPLARASIAKAQSSRRTNDPRLLAPAGGDAGTVAGPTPQSSASQPTDWPVLPLAHFWFDSLPETAMPTVRPARFVDPADPNPPVLRPPSDIPPLDEPIDDGVIEPLLQYWSDPPLGFTGPSGILPREPQQSSHFVPMEDRWRLGFPPWDRYGRGHPPLDDYPYVEGRYIDPYNQNVLKGDYPIIGQHTFLNITGTSLAVLETRQVPTPTTPFESTVDPFQEEFFGNPNQFFYTHYFLLSLDLFHGDAAFKQPDWRIKLTPIFNINYLDVQELAVVNPNVLRGTTRFDDYFALEEWFVETKLADLSPDFDFLSVRAGSQWFVSDFRGFIFADTNRAVRLFGSRLSNRDQFNIIAFDQLEKDTNSELNTFRDRDQVVFIANYYRQDVIFPGYTAQLSFHYNHDRPSVHFDTNDFLVRPDPAGVFHPHEVNAFYFGIAGDGHINRFNITHAYYYAFGHDTLNPLAGCPQDIDAHMAALELSYDRDWIRFRTSFFYASGDPDISDGRAQGFDTIFDNPNFAGGQFSYWQRQAIRLFGVNLVNRFSLVPDLRSSKIQGQSNFVNPGLWLLNFGADVEVTPRCRLVGNANLLWFDEVDVLQQFVFQESIHRFIGTDLSLGLEYRPWLNNNAIIMAGVSGLIPERGFRDLYNPLVGDVGGLFASFAQITLTY
jgi:hypothetical protein